MLKIKDNVDLKELEKYGFYHHTLIYVKTIARNGYIYIEKDIFVDEKTREISIKEGLFNIDIELDTIYDLIKDDLVEKVGE